MKQIEFVINEEVLAQLATGSLVGMLLDETDGLREPVRIELVFPRSSDEELRKRGPDQWICFEYNVPCLLQDILWLQTHGHVVTVIMRPNDVSKLLGTM